MYEINIQRLLDQLVPMPDAELDDYIAAQEATVAQADGVARGMAEFRLRYATAEKSLR